MDEEVLSYASVLRLSRRDIAVLKIKDLYSLHKVVYGLYEDHRSEEQKAQGHSSGILWADKGGDFNSRQILMLSDRKPHQTPQFGEVESKIIRPKFVQHECYGFEVTLNPVKRCKATGKIVPIRQHEDIIAWSIERGRKSWGFDIDLQSLQIVNKSLIQFEKDNNKVVYNKAVLKGTLTVKDRETFIESFLGGIGRGKAFGFGLLQLVPLDHKF
ncbi:MAG: type I-E CRISPR-associated protein Cas6/Cse3/CasE [Chlamydiota bacterium]